MYTVAKTKCFYKYTVIHKQKKNKRISHTILETLISVIWKIAILSSARFHSALFDLEILENSTADFLLKTVV